MSYRLILTHLLALLLFAIGSPALAQQPDWQHETITPGARLSAKHFGNLFGEPQFVTITAVDLEKAPGNIHFAAAQQFGKIEMTVPEIAEHSGALLAVNGGFFDKTTNANCGILKIDGELLSFSRKQPEELWFVGSSALGFDRSGKWHFLVQTNTWADDWPIVHNAIAGGHYLIIDGRINPIIEQERYDARREQRHAGARNPRTAIGFTSNHVALIMTVDGRHPGNAAGITLRELAYFFESLGCRNAINLDGGGSTTLWVRGRGVLNYPSDNKMFDHEGLRLVRTAVVIK